MKKIIIALVSVISMNTFALEGCEVVLRSGNVSSRVQPQTARSYSLGKCSWLLAKSFNSGEWEVGAAIHINENQETTFLKLEKVSREEFFNVRNGL